MPLYEYQCLKCGAVTAVQHSINDNYDAPQCTVCDTVMARQWSTPATIFKGTGWGKNG